MGRLALRVLIFVVGVTLLVVYLGVASVGYLLVVALWIIPTPRRSCCS